MGIRILLADDHRMVRTGLRALLEMQPDMEVIAEAVDGLEAVHLSVEFSPDVVVMDVTMPNMNGIDATQQIISQLPGVKVVALSIHSDRRFVRGMLKAGASGYLFKDCSANELADAIRAVARGESYLSPTIARLVVEDYVDPTGRFNTTKFAALTTREREVLRWVVEGKSTGEIAENLNLSIRTVEMYRYRIRKKLNIHKAAELVKYAIQEGLIKI